MSGNDQNKHVLVPVMLHVEAERMEIIVNMEYLVLRIIVCASELLY